VGHRERLDCWSKLSINLCKLSIDPLGVEDSSILAEGRQAGGCLAFATLTFCVFWCNKMSIGLHIMSIEAVGRYVVKLLRKQKTSNVWRCSGICGGWTDCVES
jgi:hypothetical protein